MPAATYFQILSRYRCRQFMPTAKSDFTTDAGTPVDSAIVHDPRWSLYGIDIEANIAIFVCLAPGTDLSVASFIPQTQFDAASAVLTLPLDALPALSEALPRPENLIFLFSIGRCGTTLANHILNTVDDTYALSEPRAFVSLANARHDMPAESAQSLITAVTRFMFRPPQGQAPRNFAIKFHSQVLYQADLFHRAFPDAKFLFLNRDAKSWANSFSRFLQNLGDAPLLAPDRLRNTWTILTAHAPLNQLAKTLDVTAAQTMHAPILGAVWSHYLAQFYAHKASGVPFHPLHYTDLTTNRDTTVRDLLAYCSLSDSALPAALATFDRDSQEGTAIGRGGQAIAMGVADYASLINTLAKMPNPIPWDVRL